MEVSRAFKTEETQSIRNIIKTNIASLLLDTSKKATPERFFVTQINDRIDEEEEAAETQGRGKSAGTNGTVMTVPKSGVQKKGSEMRLQRNLLAKIIIDEKETSKKLIIKRKEFEDRIFKCKNKQTQLMLKQDNNKAVVDQYTQFISEKEVIRKKAVSKYQNELKSRMQKILEHDVLKQQLQKVKEQHTDLTNQVTNDKKYKDFLTKSIEMLPDNYLEAGDSKYVSLMMRHQTLYESNMDLFENLIANSDKLKALRLNYERLVLEHNANIMTVSSKLGELQKIKDKITLENIRNEEDYHKNGDKRRADVVFIANVFSGIENLSEKCAESYKINPPNLENMDNFQKLDLIKTYLIKQAAVLKIVKQSMHQSEIKAN